MHADSFYSSHLLILLSERLLMKPIIRGGWLICKPPRQLITSSSSPVFAVCFQRQTDSQSLWKVVLLIYEAQSLHYSLHPTSILKLTSAVSTKQNSNSSFLQIMWCLLIQLDLIYIGFQFTVRFNSRWWLSIITTSQIIWTTVDTHVNAF